MRYRVMNSKGPTGEEFEGDAMTVNLKIDTLIRTTGDGSYYVQEIAGINPIHPTAGLDAPDPKASEKSSTARAGILEDPHAEGIPARTSPVLTPTPGTLGGERPAPVTSKAAETPSPAARQESAMRASAQAAAARDAGLTAPAAPKVRAGQKK